MPEPGERPTAVGPASAAPESASQSGAALAEPLQVVGRGASAWPCLGAARPDGQATGGPEPVGYAGHESRKFAVAVSGALSWTRALHVPLDGLI